ncbi:MAG: hypothetical protein M1142_06635 [Patescibacteria group bacterium]|nr:hypothetical protein [Patescibacteria group bacterium]
MLNRRVIIPVVAAAVVTATIIFGITHSRVKNSHLLSGLVGMVTQQYHK